MSELAAVRCTSCGGTVRGVAGEPLVRCLFCGEQALVPTDPPEGIEPPSGLIPFVVLEAAARDAFSKFAKSSMWYPNDLTRAELRLKRLLVPAWAWSGHCETHWTGLVRASTRSGKAPASGDETVAFDQILVPASQSLRLAELAALGPYDESALAPLDADPDAPAEVSELTRSSARARAHDEMRRRHAEAISRREGLLTIRPSSLVQHLDGRPVLVPVWIGAFRYGKRSFRILVHGQTGHLIGKAPVSAWKVVGAVALGLFVVAALVGFASLCLGCAGGGGGLLLLDR